MNSEIIFFLQEHSSSIIAILAVVISLQLSITSRKSLNTAEKALRIAEENKHESKLCIHAYLKDSITWNDSEFYYFAACAIYNNRSIQQNSLARTSIILELTKYNSKPIIIECTPCLLSSIPEQWKGRKILDFPIVLQPRASVEGVIFSKVSKKVVRDSFIQSLTLHSLDASGNEITAVSFSPRDEHA